MEWISVKDRLPKKECLAIGYQDEMIIGWLGEETYGGFTCESGDEQLTDVTHWMPLPKPPINP